MKFVISLFLLGCLIAVSEAGLAIDPNATHPDFPGKCYCKSHKTVLSPKETRNDLGGCMSLHCFEDLSLEYESCSPYEIEDPNCVEVKQDMTKHFPECCRKYKCTIDGVVSYV
ncbi:uncharacterized protein LOC129748614 [Uranotaenia lowii]|uniref:uncharacterized protein LOC129748614 n=1 Tax=Uranotaenia lowii TaxID=190385 RepID=UPI00247A915D|nr:uncharacterized protein LOC129748614 [Uranotaenia lowii]